MPDEQEFLDGCRTAYAAGGLDLDEIMRHSEEDGEDERPQTRLSLAAELGWCEAVRWLLEHGADPNAYAYSNSKLSPLHLAAHRGAACLLLLDAGAQVDAPNRYSYTPLDYASSHGACENIKLFLSRGASLDGPDSRHDDAEATARSFGMRNAAELLAEIRAAGGWAAYVTAPRIELLEFRRLLPTVRREPPSAPAPLERLFADSNVPEDVVTHVFSFWRSERDYCPDRLG